MNIEERLQKLEQSYIARLSRLYKDNLKSGTAKNTLFVGPGITEDKVRKLKLFRNENQNLIVFDDANNPREVFICSDEGEGKRDYIVFPKGTVLSLMDSDSRSKYFNPFPISGMKSFVNKDGRIVEGVVLELGKKYRHVDEENYSVILDNPSSFKSNDLGLNIKEPIKTICFNLENGIDPQLGGNMNNAARARATLLKSLSLENHTHLMVATDKSRDYMDKFNEQREIFGYDTEILHLEGYNPRESFIIMPIIMDQTEKYLDRFILTRKNSNSPFTNINDSTLKETSSIYSKQIIDYVNSHGIDRLGLSSMDNPDIIRNIPGLIRNLRADRGENFEVYFSPSNTFQSTVISMAKNDSTFNINSYYAEMLGLIDVLVFNREEAEMLGYHIWTATERKSLLSDESSPQKLVRFLAGKTRGKKVIATFGGSGIWFSKRGKGSSKETNNLEADHLFWGGHKVPSIISTTGAGDSTYGASTIGADLGLDEESILLLCVLASQYKIGGATLYDKVGSFPELKEFERSLYALGSIGDIRRSETVHFPEYTDKLGQHIFGKHNSQERVQNPQSLFKRLEDYLDVIYQQTDSI